MVRFSSSSVSGQLLGARLFDVKHGSVKCPLSCLFPSSCQLMATPHSPHSTECNLVLVLQHRTLEGTPYRRRRLSPPRLARALWACGEASPSHSVRVLSRWGSRWAKSCSSALMSAKGDSPSISLSRLEARALTALVSTPDETLARGSTLKPGDSEPRKPIETHRNP